MSDSALIPAPSVTLIQPTTTTAREETTVTRVYGGLLCMHAYVCVGLCVLTVDLKSCIKGKW